MYFQGFLKFHKEKGEIDMRMYFHQNCPILLLDEKEKLTKNERIMLRSVRDDDLIILSQNPLSSITDHDGNVYFGEQLMLYVK